MTNNPLPPVAPKAVIFDLGKVLLDFDYGIAAGNLAPFCGVGPSQIAALIDQSPLLLQYERGELGSLAFFEEVRKQTGFSETLERFKEGFAEIFSPIETMLAMHEEIRSQGIPTYVFSNTNEIATEHIRERYPFFHRFEGHVLSWQHRTMKPDYRLYEVVEQLTGWRGADLVYVDDREENIAAARKRGWRTVHHKDPARTRQAMLENGLLMDHAASAPSRRPRHHQAVTPSPPQITHPPHPPASDRV